MDAGFTSDSMTLDGESLHASLPQLAARWRCRLPSVRDGRMRNSAPRRPSGRRRLRSPRSGLTAPYLIGDVIGGHAARAAKMRAAKIRPLKPVAQPRDYLAEPSGARNQTAGIGLDVLRSATASSSGSRRPHLRSGKRGDQAANRRHAERNRAHGQDLQPDLRRRARPHRHDRARRRAIWRCRRSGPARSRPILAGHGVAKARIASRVYGETAPLYNPETDETQKAANRRVEIRLRRRYRG